MEVSLDLIPIEPFLLSEFDLNVLSKYATVNQQEVYGEICKFKSRPNFSSLCLVAVESGNIPLDRRLYSSILLKNYVTELLQSSSEVVFGHRFKEELVKIYYICDSKISTQILLTIVGISKCDFPRDWENLLEKPIQDVIERSSSITLSLGLVEASVEKYKFMDPSDEVFIEINYICDTLCPPLLDFIEERVRSEVSFATEPSIQQRICQIIHSLSFHDIPQVLHDGMPQILGFIIISLQSLLSASSDFLVCHLESIKALVLLVSLLTTKFTEDLPDVPTLIECLYSFGSRFPHIEELDEIQSIVILILEKIFIRYPASLHSQNAEMLIKDVVFPSMTPTTNHLEHIEDDPIGYIRNLAENSTGHITRADSSISLLQTIIAICGQPMLNSLMLFLESLPHSNARERMVFSRVLIAISLKLDIHGAHSFIELSDNDLKLYISKFIVPNLPSSLSDPLLFADYMKLHTKLQFRFDNMINTDFVLAAIQGLRGDNLMCASASFMLINFCNSKSTSLMHTHLNQIFISASDSFLQLLSNMSCENEFLPLLIANILLLNFNCVLIPSDSILKLNEMISHLIKSICISTYSAAFTHSSFILLGSFARFLIYIGKVDLLVPLLCSTLSTCNGDKLPYLFQIMALINGQVVECIDEFTQVLEPLLNPSFWDNPEKLYPVSIFVATTIIKGMAKYSDGWSKLVSRFAASIKTSHIASCVSSAAFLKSLDIDAAMETVGVLLSKFQASKSSNTAKAVVLLISSCFVTNAPSTFGALKRLQPNLPIMILKSLYLPYIVNYIDAQESKLALLGCIILIDEIIKSKESPAETIYDTLSAILIITNNLVLKRSLPSYLTSSMGLLGIKDLYSKDEDIIFLKVYPFIPIDALQMEGWDIYRYFVRILREHNILDSVLTRIQDTNPEIVTSIAKFV